VKSQLEGRSWVAIKWMAKLHTTNLLTDTTIFGGAGTVPCVQWNSNCCSERGFYATPPDIPYCKGELLGGVSQDCTIKPIDKRLQ